MEKSTLTNVGAVVTAALASLCCVGPLVLAGIGVAGLGSVGSAFSFFEPYQSYFTGLAVLFLGVGFFLTYRKREENCAEGKACATQGSLKMRKVGLWAITGLTGLMLAVPHLLMTDTSTPVADASLETTVLALEGMT